MKTTSPMLGFPFSYPLLLGAALMMALGAASARAQYQIQILTPTSITPGDSAAGLGINNVGQTLIQTFNPTTFSTDGYFIYNSSTKSYTLLPQDPDAIPGDQYFYNGLNDKGQIAGGEPSTSHTIPASDTLLGYLPYESLVYTSATNTFKNFMPTTPGAFVSEAEGINNAGQVVGINNTGTGDQGWLLSGGVFTTIDDPLAAGGGTTDLSNINNKGTIAGYFSDPSSSSAEEGLEYDIGTGTFTTIGPANFLTEALGINDSGEIVGVTTNDTSVATADGFIDIGGTITLLDVPGAMFTEPIGVNNAGQITGEVSFDDVNWSAFVATPVPDTGSTLATLGLALVGLAGLRRKIRLA